MNFTNTNSSLTDVFTIAVFADTNFSLGTRVPHQNTFAWASHTASRCAGMRDLVELRDR